MPHTSHRKKATQQKRIKVTDDEGWTVVKQRPKLSPHSQLQRHNGETEGEIDVDSNDPISNNIDDLSERYGKHKQTWEGSACNRSLQAILRRRLATDEITALDKCVCLGLGSVDAGLSTKSLYQFAALESMLTTLRSRFPHIDIFAQDPAFTKIDRRFLASRDITVLQTPSALSHVGPTTFIYAPHCSRTAFLSHLEGKEPALVVGNDVGKLIFGPLDTPQPMIESAEAFLESRSSNAFPDFEPYGTAFYDMRIYWKCGVEDDR